jgi:hypothetical protein
MRDVLQVVSFSAIVQSEDEEDISELDKYFVNEIEALQSVASPYVATIAPGHWGIVRGYGWIIMDFFSNGHLRSMLVKVRVPRVRSAA